MASGFFLPWKHNQAMGFFFSVLHIRLSTARSPTLMQQPLGKRFSLEIETGEIFMECFKCKKLRQNIS